MPSAGDRARRTLPRAPGTDCGADRHAVRVRAPGVCAARRYLPTVPRDDGRCNVRIAITTHAVDQYVMRVRPDLPHAAARAHLESQAPRANKLPHRTALGEEQWAIGDAVLVVKPAGKGRVAVTTLPHAEGRTRPKSPEQLDAEMRADYEAEEAGRRG